MTTSDTRIEVKRKTQTYEMKKTILVIMLKNYATKIRFLCKFIVLRNIFFKLITHISSYFIKNKSKLN